MVLLQKLWSIRFAYRMIFRSFPVLTGMAFLAASCSLPIPGWSAELIKGALFSASASNPDTSFPESSSLASSSSLDASFDGGHHSSEADERMARSERHFNAGRQLYFQGSLAGARQEFDSAVDALLNAPENLPDRRRT